MDTQTYNTIDINNPYQRVLAANQGGSMAFMMPYILAGLRGKQLSMPNAKTALNTADMLGKHNAYINGFIPSSDEASLSSGREAFTMPSITSDMIAKMYSGLPGPGNGGVTQTTMNTAKVNNMDMIQAIAPILAAMGMML